ncbi:T-cell receptor alpha chain V region PHDS58, partial [Heterocephalus glaber]
MFPVTCSVLPILLMLRGSRAQSVAQPDHHVTVSERAPLLLKCNYTYGATVSLFWYVQHPGRGFQLLLKYVAGPSLVTGIRGFKAEFKKSETSFHLEKASVQWSDAAMYFCAVSG